MPEIPTAQLNFWSIVFGYGALQGFFIGIMVFVHRIGRPSVNRRLALLIFALSLLLAEQALTHSLLHYQWPHIRNITDSFWLLLGPLTYFYVRALLGLPDISFHKQLLHYLPAVFVFLNLLEFYLLPQSEKLALMTGQLVPQQTTYQRLFPSLVAYGYLIHMVIYILVSLKLVDRREKLLKHQAADVSNDALHWFRVVMVIFLCYVAFELVATVIVFQIGGRFSPLVINISILLLSTLIFTVVIFAIRYPDIIFIEDCQNNGSAIAEVVQEQRMPSLPREPDTLLAEMHRVMQEDELFLTNDLKLHQFAGEVGLTTHQASWLLNNFAGRTFYDFVNHYRVMAARKMLIDPALREFTVSAIALEAGFNSPASFYRIFKRATGQTPAAYVKSHATPLKKIAQRRPAS